MGVEGSLRSEDESPGPKGPPEPQSPAAQRKQPAQFYPVSNSNYVAAAGSLLPPPLTPLGPLEGFLFSQ